MNLRHNIIKKNIGWCCIYLLLSAVFSCDKLPMNGDLDGMWQLMFVEKDGEVSDVKSRKRYWSFQLHLTQFSRSGNNTYRYFAHFKHEGDSLFVYDLCFPSENFTDTDDNVMFTESDVHILNQWGIYSLYNRYKVEKLDSDVMILKNDEMKLRFRKF